MAVSTYRERAFLFETRFLFMPRWPLVRAAPPSEHTGNLDPGLRDNAALFAPVHSQLAAYPNE
jgi:hypothetical protein